MNDQTIPEKNKFINERGEQAILPDLPTYNTLRGLQSERKQRDYVLPSFPVGKVGLLVGAGGTGKSIVAIQIAFQVAAGRYCDFRLSGVTLKSEKFSQVLYVSLEDEDVDLDDRLAALGEFWSHDEDKSVWLQDLTELVNFIPLSGHGVTLVDKDCNRTPTFFAVLEKAKSFQYLRLIIIDTLRRSHDAEENSSGDMSQVLRHYEELAKTTGAAVLLLHHENKAGMGDKDAGSSASRGASSIVDNARYVARLQKMTIADAEKRGIDVDTERKQWIRFSLEKTNYGPEQPDAWLKRLSSDNPILIAQVPPEPDRVGDGDRKRLLDRRTQSSTREKTDSVGSNSYKPSKSDDIANLDDLKAKKKITAKDIFG